MYALPSYVWRVRKARAKMGKKERNRHRQSLVFIAAAVALVVTLAYGDLGPYTLNNRHDRGIFKGNHGASSSSGRTLLADPISGEYALDASLLPGGSHGAGRKLLAGGGSCEPLGYQAAAEKSFAGGLVAYFVGVFFMFLGIAIVCDDFFVPALEIICEVLELSDDVAGATFMAAGSSAPELASSTVSLISPQAGSEIGVGTIVGSAIFNILIIIGATVIATGNTLQLDWKPVTRDCFFYASAIAGIVGTFAGGRVDWWEGLIYVLFYGCYIVSMVYNQRLMKWMDTWKGLEKLGSFKKKMSFSRRPTGHFQHHRSDRELTDLAAISPNAGDESAAAEGGITLRVSGDRVRMDVTPPTSPTKKPLAPSTSSSSSSAPTSKAKAGWAKLRQTVVKEHKFADAVLALKDKWKDKADLLNKPPGDVAPGSPRESCKITPTMTLGHIRAYRAEAARAAISLQAKSKAAELKARVAAQKLEEGASGIGGDGADGAEKDGGDDDDDGSPFTPPDDLNEYPLWALSVPWYAAFKMTIPPCGDGEYWRKWYLVSFFMSIAWIGFITHWMVEWCVRIGCMLKIPAVVMGTTVLAAGTSIPDALSSIAVAKDGLADMAVANAVGSNVFDIWLGLGLPWLFYLSWQSPSYITVNTNELVPSSLILAGVLVLYYGGVATNGFKLTTRMGWIFIATYGVYAMYSIFLVWLLDVYDLQEGSTLK